MSLRTLIALLLSAAVFSAFAARADGPAIQAAPFVAAADAPALPGGELRSFVAARRALELGFPSVAAEIYERLLGSVRIVGAERNVLVLELVTARLDQGRISDAEKALERYQGAPSPAQQLRAGLIAVRLNRKEAAKAVLAALKPDQLAVAERGWWYFLQGEAADAAGDFAKARDAYQAATDAAVSDVQRAQFVLARERARLSAGDVTEAQLNTLRQGAERYQGRTVGHAYARQYAALLAAKGRADEAVAFLGRQLLALPAGERVARDDFRLLLGVIAGPARAEGRNALDGLLTSAEDPTLQRVALQLMARDAAGVALYAKLNVLITASPPHPILGDLLLARAQLALAEKRMPVVERAGSQDPVILLNQAQAELDAKGMLAKFPNSPLKPAALGLLADLAWQLKRFRSAADYAAQARVELPAGDVKASLSVLVAEAYFLAGDYAAASVAYGAALSEQPAGVAPGLLIAQRVLSLIRDGRLDEAMAGLDSFVGDRRLDDVHRWQAEWTLAQAMEVAGRGAEAYARINLIMTSREGAGSGSLPVELRARLAWLQAKLSLESDDPQKTLALAAELPEKVKGVDEGLRSEIEASTRLLQAKALFRLGKPGEALKRLDELRTDFPKADAAVYSYIDEADYYADNNRLVDAQARLIKLAGDFSQHPYAPYALYRAALSAEQRGQDEYYEEAYRILERLVKDYPTDRLVFYALLKQGDLARRLNEFARARLTYEFLINNYTVAQQPDVLAAELALAACHRAQITPSDVSHHESALTILERLQDLADAPEDLRVEAAFQLGDLLAAKGKSADPARAEAVWWTLATTFLLDDARAEKLGPKGRYWMARALLRLGDLRRERGDLEEARNAYELVLTKKLPFAALARDSFIRTGGSL